jgi:AcrR family transcriptional regulator
MSERVPKPAATHRKPVQHRSRASFERLLDTGLAMVRESGHADFSLADVSRRAKVAISSIYYRVKNKDDLVRLIQQRAYEEYDRDYARLVADIRHRDLTLHSRVAAMVKGVAELMRRHSSVFSAMIELAPHDPLIAATGQQYFQTHLREWTGLLLELRDQISHPDPDQASKFTYTLVMNVIGRRVWQTTAGSGKAGEKAWQSLFVDLAVACVALLEVNPKSVRRVTSA